jgi:hypothetical protein
MKPRIIAQSGAWYLLKTDEDRGRVLDLEHGRLFPEMGLTAILARGYWTDFGGDPEPIYSALNSVETLDDSRRGQSQFQLGR